MDESHKHNVEQKKPETKEYILYNPIYIKFKKYKTNLKRQCSESEGEQE